MRRDRGEAGEAWDDRSFWASPQPFSPAAGSGTAAFWGCLSKAEQTLLNAVGTHVRHPAGQQLLRPGAAPRHVLIVRRGRAAPPGELGQQHNPHSYGLGDLIGAEAALTGQVPTSAIIAHTAVEALMVPCDDFIAFLAHHPTASLALLRLQAQRLQAGQAPAWKTSVHDSHPHHAAQSPSLEEQRSVMVNAAPGAEAASGPQFWLLGPVSASDSEGPIDLGSPKQRLLLSILLLADGRLVSTDRLIDALWGDDVPDSATHMLHSYISRLRRVLSRADEPPGSLASGSGGYRLAVASERVDVHRFRTLARQGRAAHEAGNLDSADRLLRAALDEWGDTGLENDPLAGLPGLWAGAARTQLADERDRVLLLLARIGLAAGRHEQVLPTLQAFTRTHLFNEEAIQLLMIALVQAGRRAEAMSTYRQARENFATHLGLDPSQSLSDLHRRILAEDPSLASNRVDAP